MREVQVGTVRIAGSALTLIAGPCVIESDAHAIELALAIRDIASAAGVPFIFKASFDKANRTSLASYRGPGLDKGVRVLAEVKQLTREPGRKNDGEEVSPALVDEYPCWAADTDCRRCLCCLLGREYVLSRIGARYHRSARGVIQSSARFTEGFGSHQHALDARSRRPNPGPYEVD